MSRVAHNKTGYDKVKSIVEESGCKLLSETYINQYEEIEIQCKCGEVYKQVFKTFKNSPNKCCDSCRIEAQKLKDSIKRFERVKKKVESLGCEFLTTELFENQDFVQVRCKCGNEFSIMESNIRKSTLQCQKCWHNQLGAERRLSTKQIQERIDKKYGDDMFKLISNPTNRKVKVKLMHTGCKRSFEISRLDVILDKRNTTGIKCPYCYGKSVGEQRIAKFLYDFNIKFTTEKTFDGLVSDTGTKLRYDFAIFDNNKIRCLIEYDGVHHYSEEKFKGNVSDIERVKKHDKIKDEFSITNNIPLIRIGYLDYPNIFDILIQNKIIPSQASWETTGRCND